MIVLDTNVLSALMQSQPEAGVVDWLDQQPAESVWTTAINVFEIRYGLHQLAHGKLRRALEEAFTALLDEDLEGRVLAFDTAAADQAARLAGERRRAGRPVDMRDTQIAGICEARNATLATRNTRHFEDLRTPVVNPWNEQGAV
ncbi:type II toxin-antitoxin system VapC family toxin [Allochromatium tepidum]|uniref:Ribonuclease VapC n=1 Tax=Allochromatium tepidum TaxID=553982 RepID=A0ABN6G805_9GAMM|nr:type II toxin-antitoxin system VapC family toxin [Allochromatium tepidum]BCU06037.1 ribonuclease VapC [Allochromatium tepidum]